jgi:hypothetical protein
MATSITDIFERMRQEGIAKASEAGNTEAVAMFSNTSKVAIWRIIYYAIAFCIYTHETIFDAFVTTVSNLLAAQLPHTLRWYRTKALAFQSGFNLVIDTDRFDNTGYTDSQIEASKVVAYAAVNEATVDNIRSLIIKIAGKDTSGSPTQLSDSEQIAFTAYMTEIKDAGNRLIIYNRQADLIKATVNFYYNPLLLDGNGNRLDGGSGKPVEDAANAFPFQLDFNGEFILAQFVDAMQNAYGASRRRVDLISFQKKTGLNPYESVASSFVPDAGYAKFDVDGLTINYLPDVPA